MTLTERRKRIREARTALALALDYMQPHMRDMKRSDQMVENAELLLRLFISEVQA